MAKQTTLLSPVTISGKGLHTGKNVTMTIKPAPEGYGIRFKRIDIEGSPEVEADIDNVVDTSRGTSIAKNGAKICTIEHTMAALSGLSIDNACIEIDNSETPILDGSSRQIFDAVEKAGAKTLEKDREYIEIDSSLTYRDSSGHAEITAVPAERQRISVMIDYNSRVLGTQHAVLDNLEDFGKEIAPSRTFVFLHELEPLFKHNLIKGGDLDNAIVFVEHMISPEELARLEALFNNKNVKVLEEGVLNNVKLHFANEPARHKLLDMVGDLALLGAPLNAHIIAHRPGHASNIEFARKLRASLKKTKQKDMRQPYDPGKPPLYDINAIRRMLPHRPPFLLLDKVLEMDESHIVGVKNVTMNESFFTGHFPEEPVMPGVLQIEAMAQCGGIFALCRYPDPENYITYFLKIENARFKNKVVPGDTLVFYLELLTPIRRGICHMKGEAFVGDKLVMDAVLLAQITKKPGL